MTQKGPSSSEPEAHPHLPMLKGVEKIEPREVPEDRAIVGELLKSLHRTALAVFNGITIEASSIVSPQMKKKIMGEYRRTTKDMPIIRDKVRVMRGLLEQYYPGFTENSDEWKVVWKYYYTEAGLWGRAG